MVTASVEISSNTAVPAENLLKGIYTFVRKYPPHSALRRNLTKVQKTWTGPSLGGRAWSRGPKSALSKILRNKEHYQKFSKTKLQK